MFRRSLAALSVLLFLLGCPGPTIQTSVGPRSSTEVLAQDTVADVLKLMRDTYREAVAYHDGPQGQLETLEIHARHRKLLNQFRPGLDASWDGLITWKKTSSATAPIEILRSISVLGPEFLDFAVEVGILKASQANDIKKVLQTVLPAPGTASLERLPRYWSVFSETARSYGGGLS